MSSHARSRSARAAIIRARWHFLAEASALLDQSLDYQETIRSVVDLVVPRMADFAAIALFADDGSLKWGYSSHADPAKASVADQMRSYEPQLTIDGNPTERVLRTGETQVVKVVDDAFLRSVARDDPHLSLLRQLDPTSLMYLRLTARDKVLGTLVLATDRTSGRTFTDRDVAIANEIARRVSLALDHALLFRAAEEAAKAREQVMAVVSHDLKNPLATIQMSASFLLEELVADDAANKPVRDQLNVIQRTARRMDRLIHDLLNVAAIEGGKLVVARSPMPVDTLVADAVDLLQPLAKAKHIALEVEVPPALPRVNADGERMLQVFSNLGGNAV